jgi:hypothetical protein
MSLSDDIKDDLVSEFLDTNEFAEQIVFCPYNAAAVTIAAVIDRKPKEPTIEDNNRSLSNEAEIMIARDATYGRATIDVINDKVQFPPNIDGDNEDWTIAEIISQDNGCWHLRVAR